MQARKKMKVAVIGKQGVGKTALIEKYVYGELTQTSRTYMGNVYKKELEDCDVSIWDTSGNENFADATNFMCRDADAIVCVIDHNDGDVGIRKALAKINDALQESNVPDVQLHIVINQCDKNSAAVAQFVEKLKTQIKNDVKQDASSLLKNKTIEITKTSVHDDKPGMKTVIDDITAPKLETKFNLRRPSISFLFVANQSGETEEQKKAPSTATEHTAQLHLLAF